jgi:predicted DNA-binding protein (UPF0251 family)/predicted Fe-Mo cluster-binding NifX family protein
MSRPPVKKRVCAAPLGLKFGLKGVGPKPILPMSVEQLEVIRLIDYKGYTQEEAASYMGIARTSVQKLYHEARVMMAEAIFIGKDILVKGGKYDVIKGHHCLEDDELLIAIIAENDQVSHHFGKARTHVLVTVKEDKVVSIDRIDLEEAHCHNQASLLTLNLDAVITGGIGEKPYNNFIDQGVEVYTYNGSIEEAINAYINQSIEKIIPHTHHHSHKD